MRLSSTVARLPLFVCVGGVKQGALGALVASES